MGHNASGLQRLLERQPEQRKSMRLLHRNLEFLIKLHGKLHQQGCLLTALDYWPKEKMSVSSKKSRLFFI